MADSGHGKRDVLPVIRLATRKAKAALGAVMVFCTVFWVALAGATQAQSSSLVSVDLTGLTSPGGGEWSFASRTVVSGPGEVNDLFFSFTAQTIEGSWGNELRITVIAPDGTTRLYEGPEFGFSSGGGLFSYTGALPFPASPAEGTWEFRFWSTWSSGHTYTGAITLRGSSGSDPLELELSAAAATLTRGQEMTPITATATGGDGSYVFSVSPALPAGLSIDTDTGTISGTPSVAASLDTYIVTVQDGTGATETANVQIAVAHPALGLELSVASATLTRGQPMTPITATATGGDETYSFSIFPALPAGLSMDTGTGTISGTPTAEALRTTHTVTVEDGTGTTATAQLCLACEEDDPRVIDAFTDATSAFIANRMDRILSAEPRGYRFDNRRSRGLSELTARADGERTTLRFAGNHVTPDNAWHFWAEGEYASYRHALQPGQQRSGHFGMLSAGADYLLTPSLALGLMAQFDTARESRQDLSNLSGQGWMVGPYLTGEITPSLFFALRGAVGTSRNSAEIDIYEDGGPLFDGDFQTRRTLLRGALYGVHELDSGVVLSPEIDLAWMREHQRDYTVSNGLTSIAVPGVNTEVGRMTLATMIEKPFDDGQMIVFARPSVAWNFTQSGPARVDAVRGSLELGFRTGGASSWNATGALRFDGLGSKNHSSQSVRVALSRQF
ncbi:MAG: autotransporter domain-containing protein [Rhodobacteraceae bacterium]|nr:autotransporter domain-containing protein [Paracoccaceae bacterium]